MSDQAKDDWPSHYEELTRKGAEVLSKWTERQEKGAATKKDLFIVTDVLFDLMSGLADKELVHLCAQINTEIRNEAKAKAKK